MDFNCAPFCLLQSHLSLHASYLLLLCNAVAQVRWADIEERKSQMRRRDIGFVVGQTDWARMTDDSFAERALNRTKYI